VNVEIVEGRGRGDKRKEKRNLWMDGRHTIIDFEDFVKRRVS